MQVVVRLLHLVDLPKHCYYLLWLAHAGHDVLMYLLKYALPLHHSVAAFSVMRDAGQGVAWSERLHCA